MNYVLASNSPRRKELLSQIVKTFEIIPSKGEEKVDPSLSPKDTACSLAEQKCDEVFALNTDKIVIGCDTIVVFNNKILGKPKNEEDAKNTLTALSGKTHYVITGVCIRKLGKKLIKFEETEVKFNFLSQKFIQDYVNSGSPMDKAGSYGIQDYGVVKEYFGKLNVAILNNSCGNILFYENNKLKKQTV